MASLRPFPPNAHYSTVGPALLFVNVDWCGHCKRARPIMEQVSGVLGSVVPVYDVNGEERPDLAKALGVRGFPTIIYVSEDGKPYRYEGDRTQDAITSFVCHNSASRHQFCSAVR